MAVRVFCTCLDVKAELVSEKKKTFLGYSVQTNIVKLARSFRLGFSAEGRLRAGATTTA